MRKYHGLYLLTDTLEHAPSWKYIVKTIIAHYLSIYFKGITWSEHGREPYVNNRDIWYLRKNVESLRIVAAYHLTPHLSRWLSENQIMYAKPRNQFKQVEMRARIIGFYRKFLSTQKTPFQLKDGGTSMIKVTKSMNRLTFTFTFA